MPIPRTPESLAVLLVGMCLASATAPGAPVTPGECTPPDQVRGDAGRGAALHLRHCAGCHGVDGNPEGMQGALQVQPGNQADPAYMASLSDGDLFRIICLGGSGTGRSEVMPPWGDLLSAQDIIDLVAQVRSFAGT